MFTINNAERGLDNKMKMKRLAALFMSAVMIMGSMQMTIRAEDKTDTQNALAEKTTVLSFDDFSDFTGGIPTGYKAAAANLKAEDGAVHMDKGGVLTKYFDEAIDGKIIMSAKIRTHAAGAEGFVFTLKDSADREYKTVHITPKGLIRVFNGKSEWSGETAGDYKANTWYKYTFEYNTLNKTINLFVDDKELVHEFEVKEAVENIQSVSFKCTSAAIDIDDIMISTSDEAVTEEPDTMNDTFLMVGSGKAKYKNNIMALSILDPSVKTFERNGEVYVPLNYLLEAYEIPSTLNTDDNSRKFCINNDIYTVYDGGNVFLKNSGTYKSKYDVITENGITYLPIDMIKSIFSKSVLREDNIVVLSDHQISKNKYKNAIKRTEIQLGESGENAKEQILDFGKAESLLPDDVIEKFEISGVGAETNLVEINDSSVDFKKALSVTTTIQPKNYWDSKIYFNIGNADVKKNDICLITLYARTISSTDESTNAQTEAVFEEEKSPWTKSCSTPIAMDGKWRKYYIPFPAVIDYPAGTAQFNLRIGYKPQVFEVADVHMYNFGSNYSLNDMPVSKTDYPGIENDAEWRKEALKNVEKNKTNKLTVNVSDENGNPVNGVKVTVKETNPNFKWGTSVNQWLITGQNYISKAEGKKDMYMYRDTLLKYFNLAVPENALKWREWEDGRAVNSRMCVDWLLDHGIEVKGHYLYWDGVKFVPDKYKSMISENPVEFNKIIKKHIYSHAQMFKNEITIWDAINECSANRAVINRLGEEEYKEWFDIAKEANPNAVLYVNETALVGTENFQHKELTKILQNMIKNGVNFDGVGLQGHFGAVPAGPEAFLKQIEHFAEVSGGKRIMLTEYDMLSQDEDIQSDFIRDIMIACYSNANTDGFIMWGHWDTDHWRKNAPNFRADWTIKPAGQTWYRLSQYVWNTNVEGLSDADGNYAVNAYQGKYKITVEKDGLEKTVDTEVSKDGTITITL